MDETVYVTQDEYDQLVSLGHVPSNVRIHNSAEPEIMEVVSTLEQTDFKLSCGHVVYWYGFADPDKSKRFPPPATLWCNQCRRRTRTS